LLAALLVAGCGAEFSNASFDSDQAFLEAVPRLLSLRMAAPLDSPSGANAQTLTQALHEPAAELYVATRTLQVSVDRGVLGYLRFVERLVEEPPSERGADRRIWGPSHHPLDPFDSRFVMDRAAPGRFVYALELSPHGADPAWRAVVAGEWSPEGADGEGSGAVTFDLDGLRELGASVGQGVVQVDYEERGVGGREVAVQFDDYAEQAGSGAADLTVSYLRGVDGAGDLEWALWEDDELIEVRSRFTAQGSGRTDLRVSWPGERADVVLLSECWDEQFTSVYRQYTPSTRPEWGDVAACALPDLALPERVSAPSRP